MISDEQLNTWERLAKKGNMQACGAIFLLISELRSTRAKLEAAKEMAHAIHAFTSIVSNRIDAVFYERDFTRMKDALAEWSKHEKES